MLNMKLVKIPGFTHTYLKFDKGLYGVGYFYCLESDQYKSDEFLPVVFEGYSDVFFTKIAN